MLPAQMHNFLKKVCLLPLTSGKHPESFSLAGKGQVLKVSVVDGFGREIHVPESVELSGNDSKIDIRSLKPGLYWVKIKTSTGVAVERLVKR